MITDTSSAHIGTVTLKDQWGNEYKGTMTSDGHTGTFTYTRANGATSMYIGEYSNGMFNGKGLYTYAGSWSDECEWRNSNQHGLCVNTDCDGHRELQEFNYGSRRKTITEGV